MGFLEALQTNPFIQIALLSGIAASIASGLIGSYIVVKRISFISGCIAHSVLSGMGICLWLNRTKGFSYLLPIHGAIISAIISAWIIGLIQLKYREREDATIGAIWSLGMSIGVLFTSLTPGYNVELTSFLVGNILWVSPRVLTTLCFLDAFILICLLIGHKRFLAIFFDEEHARIQGLSVNTYYLFLLTLIALSVVILIQVLGIFLVIAMLTIPATLANTFTNRLSMMMFLAVLLSCMFCTSGTIASFYLNWPPGPTIALISCISYLSWMLNKKLSQKRKSKK